MFNKKPKTKELLQGEDLYKKLSYSVYEGIRPHTDRIISKLMLEMKVEKMFFYTKYLSDIMSRHKAIFLTEEKEVGLLEINNRIIRDSYFFEYQYSNYTYISGNSLHIKRNRAAKHSSEKAEKVQSYSIYLDECYSPKKKMEKINYDLKQKAMRRLAKQLIYQKINRF